MARIPMDLTIREFMAAALREERHGGEFPDDAAGRDGLYYAERCGIRIMATIWLTVCASGRDEHGDAGGGDGACGVSRLSECARHAIDLRDAMEFAFLLHSRRGPRIAIRGKLQCRNPTMQQIDGFVSPA